MTQLFAPSLDDQIFCVERELRFRARVYPRLVADRKMTQEKANRETEIMQAVLRTLMHLRGEEHARRHRSATAPQ